MFQSGKYSAEQVASLMSTLESGKIELTLDISSTDETKLTIEGIKNELIKASQGLLTPSGFLDLGAKFDTYASSVSRMFGMSKKDVEGIKSIFAESFEDITRLGGTQKDVVNIQQAMSDTFHTNVIATSDIVKDLYEVNKVTNVSSKELIEGFRSAGFHTTQISDKMQEVVDYSRSVGVNVYDVASKVTDNLGKLNLFNFDNGVQGIAKMAAHSTMFGIDMRKTFDLSEKLLDPEKAIELSASLQRLGVTSTQLLDPLRAMDLAQNDPEELQKQLVNLSQQFVRTKEDGSFEILPGAKRQLREVATALGMTGDELAKMALQSADANKKLSEMRLPEFTISEEQKMMISNMSKLNKEGKYEVTFTDEKGEKQTKLIENLLSTDLDLLKEQSKPKPMDELIKSQLTEIEITNNLLREIRDKESIAFASSNVYSTAARGIRRSVEKQAEPLTTGKTASQIREGYMEELKKSDLGKKIDAGNVKFEDVENFIKTMSKQYGENVVSNLDKIVESMIGKQNVVTNTAQSLGIEPGTVGGLASALIMFGGKIADLTTKLSEFMSKVFNVNDFIISQGKLLKYNENDLIIGGTHLMDVKEPEKIEKKLLNNDNDNSTSRINAVNMSERQMINNVNVDLTPLTAFMSNFTTPPVQIIPPTTNDFATKNNLELQKQISDLTKSSLSNTPLLTLMSDIKNNDFKSSNDTQIQYIKNNTLLENIFKSIDSPRNNESVKVLNDIQNLNNGNVVERTTISPTIQTPSIPKIENLSQTHEHKFSDIKISLSVDIPNLPNANVSTEQIKSVLEQTVNSHDFKQQLAIKINQASTNDGLTAQGGTANYGAQKTNYSLG